MYLGAASFEQAQSCGLGPGQTSCPAGAQRRIGSCSSGSIDLAQTGHAVLPGPVSMASPSAAAQELLCRLFRLLAPCRRLSRVSEAAGRSLQPGAPCITCCMHCWARSRNSSARATAGFNLRTAKGARRTQFVSTANFAITGLSAAGGWLSAPGLDQPFPLGSGCMLHSTNPVSPRQLLGGPLRSTEP